MLVKRLKLWMIPNLIFSEVKYYFIQCGDSNGIKIDDMCSLDNLTSFGKSSLLQDYLWLPPLDMHWEIFKR